MNSLKHETARVRAELRVVGIGFVISLRVAQLPTDVEHAVAFVFKMNDVDFSFFAALERHVDVALSLRSLIKDLLDLIGFVVSHGAVSQKIDDDDGDFITLGLGHGFSRGFVSIYVLPKYLIFANQKTATRRNFV